MWPLARSNSSAVRPPSATSSSSRAHRSRGPPARARAWCRRRRRTGRPPRTSRGSSTPCTRARASPGPPGTAASDIPPPSAVFTTPNANRSGSVRDRPFGPDADVRLLGLAPLDQRASPEAVGRVAGALAGSRRSGPRRATAPGVHPCSSHQLEQLVVPDVAGGHDHHVARARSAGGRSAEPGRASPPDALLGAEDRPAERVTGPQRLGEQVVDEVARASPRAC